MRSKREDQGRRSRVCLPEPLICSSISLEKGNGKALMEKKWVNKPQNAAGCRNLARGLGRVNLLCIRAKARFKQVSWEMRAKYSNLSTLHTGGIFLRPAALCLFVCFPRCLGIAPSRYDVLLLFLLLWFVEGRYDDLTFYQVRIIGGGDGLLLESMDV